MAVVSEKENILGPASENAGGPEKMSVVPGTSDPEDSAARYVNQAGAGRSSFEEILARDGRLIYRFRGVSMLPLLRQKKDLVIIEAVGGSAPKSPGTGTGSAEPAQSTVTGSAEATLEGSTGSAEPAPDGGTAAKLKPLDVAFYRRGNQYVLHRVISIEKTYPGMDMKGTSGTTDSREGPAETTDPGEKSAEKDPFRKKPADSGEKTAEKDPVRKAPAEEIVYLIRGDNTYRLERVPARNVIGKMTGFVRGGSRAKENGFRIGTRSKKGSSPGQKTGTGTGSESRNDGRLITVEDRGYRLYSRFWNAVYPVRAAVVFGIRSAKRLARRLRFAADLHFG